MLRFINPRYLLALEGSDPVHMSVPAQVTGDINPKVPGAADSLQDLSM